jgi:predicted PolB exonuclease-like 3'-5' exonuclease
MIRAVLDIETVPENPELLQTKEDEKRASLDALSARVACIGVIVVDGMQPRAAVAITDACERTLLTRFWQFLAQERVSSFVVHNGLSFDLPFLWKRSVILQIKPTMSLDLKKYRTDAVFDTMYVWSNWEMRGAPSLDRLASGLGVGQKSGCGSEVLPMWQLGQIDDLCCYCMRDTWLTYACFCRMNFVQPVSEEDIKNLPIKPRHNFGTDEEEKERSIRP